jgi:hypothetical protein
MQKSINTDELFAVSTEPKGKSASLYSFYKVTEDDSVLCITAEGWADRRWRPKQLRVIENLDSNPRRDIRRMDCYAEMEELDWNELMLALNSADTCRLNINNKLQP